MLGDINSHTGGWTCAFCGAFIMHNTYHACVVPQPLGDYSVTVGDTNQDTEITKKLDKIIELLEKISRRVL